VLESFNQRHPTLAKKHGAKHLDLSVYSHDVCQLFQATSEISYNELLKDLQKKWDLMFNEYYVNNIHKSISSIDRWILEKLGIYN